MKKITIKDVAREAGVSITTVSHALSGRGVLKKETRERVIAIAHQMQYMPDWNGRNLKSVKTGLVGLFTESIRGYYGQLADFMCEECRVNGYELDIFVTNNEEILLGNLLSGRVDGAVILHHGFQQESMETLIKAEVPTVFLDREVSGKSVSSVLLDSYQTGRVAAEYLYGLGHRRILFVKGENTYDGNERLRGFCDFMKEHGLTVEQDYQICGEFDRGIAFESMTSFLQKNLPIPEAVFAANDDSAFGCIKALAEAGYSVPDQISVMGCDNIELSGWYTPALTTIHTGIDRQGISAVNQIVGLIEGRQQGQIEKIAGKLVERVSCKHIA